VLPPEPLQVSA
jgi:hypothetical protein